MNSSLFACYECCLDVRQNSSERPVRQRHTVPVTVGTKRMGEIKVILETRKRGRGGQVLVEWVGLRETGLGAAEELCRDRCAG